MVQSKALTVDGFMEEVDEARRPAFERLRALCLETLTGWEEKMAWGMPGYGPPGADPAVSFNAQKRHIALYAGRTAIERAGDRLAGIDCGKGCIRYASPKKMDFEVIADMLKDIRARGGKGCA